MTYYLLLSSRLEKNGSILFRNIFRALVGETGEGRRLSVGRVLLELSLNSIVTTCVALFSAIVALASSAYFLEYQVANLILLADIFEVLRIVSRSLVVLSQYLKAPDDGHGYLACKFTLPPQMQFGILVLFFLIFFYLRIFVSIYLHAFIFITLHIFLSTCIYISGKKFVAFLLIDGVNFK